MARLPEPGKDAGQWGDILNDFLSQSIAADGSLNIGSVGDVQLKPNAVTSAAIADGAVISDGIASGAVTAEKLADGAVAENQLADDSVTTAKLRDAGSANGPAILDEDAKVPAAVIPMDAIADSAEIKATYAERWETLRSVAALRVLIDGDSIAAQCPDEDSLQANGFQNAYSWAEWANVALSGRLNFVENLGIGGQRTGQMLSRIDASLAVDCDVVFLSALTNDLFDGTGTTVAQMQENIAALYKAHTDKGRIVVHLLPGPSGYANSTSLANAYTMHRWLFEYVRSHAGIYLVNAHAVAADPADGLPISYYSRPEDGMSGRGVHPGYLWAAKIGKEVAAVLEPLCRRIPILEAPSNADTRNALPNGKMTGNVSGMATGYSVTKSADGTAATATVSKVARSDGRPGEAQQIYIAPGDIGQGPRLFVQDTTPGGRWNVGDTVRLVIHFETDSDTAGSYPGPMFLRFWNGLGSADGMGKRGVDVNLPAGVDALPRKGRWRTKWATIPAGTARLQISMPLPYGTTRILSVEIQRASV